MSKDYSIREVADLTGMHPKTVARLARQGVFPHAYKAGTGSKTSPVRIPLRDVEAYRSRQPRAAA
jgi:predicted DNA-binding transcriptional regulator AlpA